MNIDALQSGEGLLARNCKKWDFWFRISMSAIPRPLDADPKTAKLMLILPLRVKFCRWSSTEKGLLTTINKVFKVSLPGSLRQPRFTLCHSDTF